MGNIHLRLDIFATFLLETTLVFCFLFLYSSCGMFCVPLITFSQDLMQNKSRILSY